MKSSTPDNGEMETYEFGSFCLDPNTRQLLKDGEPVPLVRKALDTLLVLVANRGQIVERELLIRELWPSSFVEESNLTQYIYLLRKTLNGDGEAYIETLHKHGYRFVGDVRVISRKTTTSQPDTSLRETGQEISGAQSDQRERTKWIIPGLLTRLHLIAGGGVLMLLTFAALFIYYKQERLGDSVAHKAEINSLAILPFKQIGRDDDHLGLGIADALITRIGKLQFFPVRPTSAVLSFADKRIDAAEAGRQLRVDAVLEGTFQREGETLRVSVQLVRVSNGNQIWADKFEEKFTGLFNVQDAIAEKMARSLRWQLNTDTEAFLKKRSTTSIEAYQAYLIGYHLWSKRTETDLFKAVENFQRAIEIDPNYALAYATLADAYLMISFYQFGPIQEYNEKSLKAVARALDIDPTISDAYVTLGGLQRVNGDKVAANESFKKAIELSPYNATARMRFAWALASDLNIVDAEREMRLAQEYDPLSIVNNVALGQILVFRRNDKEAIKYLERARDLSPETCYTRLALATIYVRQDRHEDALRLIEEQQEQLPPLETAVKAYVYAKTGRRTEALQLAGTLKKNPRIMKNGSYTLGLTYFILGQKEEAFHWIEVSLRSREESPIVLAFDPDFDEAKADPKYEEIVRRVKSIDNSH